MSTILRQLIYCILYLLILFQLYRMAFYIFNFSLFKQITLPEASQILMGGLFFDYILTPFFITPLIALTILMIIFDRIKVWRKIIIIYSIFVILITTILLLTDLVYYHYNYHHISKTDLSIIFENRGLTLTFALPYWYLLLALVPVIVITYKGIIKYISVINKSLLTRKKKVIIILSIFFVFIVSVIITGKEKEGFGFATPSSVFRFSAPGLSAVTINSTYLFLYSLIDDYKEEDLLTRSYGNSGCNIQHQITRSTPYNGYFKGKNIFIIVIEGSSRELFIDSMLPRPHIPFLDSLKKESLFFSNAFANGLNSPEGINAILGGMPNLLSKPFNKSIYVNNDNEYLGHKLAGMGYNNNFFYSADKNATGFSKVANLYGIPNYFSATDFEGLSEDKQLFGVYDHLFFPAVSGKMKTLPTPFFSVLFNVSTHNPFTLLPDSLLGITSIKKPDLSQAYEYYDNVLKDFFKTISTYEWYKNTLFVFVADHYSRSKDLIDFSDVGIFRIPIFMYSPGTPLKGEYRMPVQQTDLPLTLLNLAGYQGEFNTMGNNIFDTAQTRPHYVINRIGDRIQIINDSLMLSYSYQTNKTLGLWNYQNDRLLSKDLSEIKLQETDKMYTNVKCLLQEFKDYLLRNKPVQLIR